METNHDESLTRDASTSVRREARFDNDPDEVRAALTDEDLLSAWLGPWRTEGGVEQVQTDDGVRRTVRDRRERADGVSWTWYPHDDPAATSEVQLIVAPEGTGTLLTIHETWTGAGPRAASVRASARARAMEPHWTAAMLALGAVLVGLGVQLV